MTDAIVSQHAGMIIGALSLIYREGQLIRAGAQVSNGRGGFTTVPDEPVAVLLQRENDMSEMTRRNIGLDKALIYVARAGIPEPREGDTLVITGTAERYIIDMIKTDPVGACFECVCNHNDT